MKAMTLLTPPAGTYNTSNPPTSLSLATLPVPVPGPTQVLIRVHAVAITPYELSWPAPAGSPTPRIPAHDVAGTVVSSPAGSKFEEGDRVFALLDWAGQGGMAEYAVCEERLLAKKPSCIDSVEAASVPRAALTALQASRDVEQGMKVLVTGVTGAVGRIALQIANGLVSRETGVLVAVGGVGSERLQGRGVDVVINYHEVEGGIWEDVAKREAKGPFDFFIDCVGGETLERGMRLMKGGGKVVTVGSPPPAWAKKGENGWEEVWEERGDVRFGKRFFIVKESGDDLRQIVDLVEGGYVSVHVGLVVDGLTEEGVRDAYSRALAGELRGSAVVKIV